MPELPSFHFPFLAPVVKGVAYLWKGVYAIGENSIPNRYMVLVLPVVMWYGRCVAYVYLPGILLDGCVHVTTQRFGEHYAVVLFAKFFVAPVTIPQAVPLLAMGIGIVTGYAFILVTNVSLRTLGLLKDGVVALSHKFSRGDRDPARA